MEQKTGENKTQAELQEVAAKALLREGIKFRIKGLGKFNIKPLKLGVLVSISIDALKIEAIEGNATAMNVIASTQKYARPATLIIAKAILNSTLKIKLFSRLLARILESKLTPEELHNLSMAVVAQSNADFFFSCTNLFAGMRMMEPKESTKETTASGEPLPG